MRHGDVSWYLDRLAQAGCPTVPTLEEAHASFRIAALWGLVIGWLITPPQNYGVEVTTAYLQRLCAAVEDLETLSAIDAAH